MQQLRNTTTNTHLLILHHLSTKNIANLTQLGAQLDITQQATSTHLKELIKQGLALKSDHRYRPTIKGTQYLQNGLQTLQKNIAELLYDLPHIDTTTAIAKTPIKTGDRISLHMKDGWLYATTKKPSKSTGIAQNDVQQNEPVIIGLLEGIIDHTPGKIHLIQLPTPQTTAPIKTQIKDIQDHLKKHPTHLIAVLDTTAKSYLNLLHLKSDLDFAVVDATIDAAQRGLSVTVLGTATTQKRLINRIDELNTASAIQLPYALHTI